MAFEYLSKSIEKAMDLYKKNGDVREASDIELAGLLRFIQVLSTDYIVDFEGIRKATKHFLENRGFLYAEGCEI